MSGKRLSIARIVQQLPHGYEITTVRRDKTGEPRYQVRRYGARLVASMDMKALTKWLASVVSTQN